MANHRLKPPKPAPPQRLYANGFGGLHVLVLIVTIAAAVIAIFFAGYVTGAAVAHG